MDVCSTTGVVCCGCVQYHWSGVLWYGADVCSTTGVVWCGMERMCAAPLEWCGVVWSGCVQHHWNGVV